MESQVDQIQKLQQVVEIVLRRKAILLTFILLGTAIGLVFYIIQPKVYQSSSLLIFQKQKVSPSQMSPDQQGRIRDVISTISQVVQSRTSLEKIIETEGLYEEEREYLPMQDVVESMRKKIGINPSRRGDTFNISFKGGDPNIVARVTNSLAARFVEENLKYRQERATETSNYAQDELDMAKEMLDKKEAILRDYKLKYYNEMPEQRVTNMSRLNALQEQYQLKQESIQDLERTRVLIGDQIAARRQLLENSLNSSVPVTANNAPVRVMGKREQLERMEARLVRLQERYTDKHPKIKSLKKKIDRLEEKVASEKQEKPVVEAVDKATGEIVDQPLFNLQLQLKEIGLNIAKINKEMQALLGQIEKYEQWVAAAPVREAEWSSVTREYGELKRHYDFLVAQNLQARSAMNLERKQQGSQFKIEDAARVPVKPIKPDFLKIMAMAILIGAGIGGGLALGFEFLNSSFRDPVTLENAFGLEVICSIPNVSLKREVVRRRIWSSIGIIAFGTCSAVILVAMLYFWKQGHIVL